MQGEIHSRVDVTDEEVVSLLLNRPVFLALGAKAGVPLDRAFADAGVMAALADPLDWITNLAALAIFLAFSFNKNKALPCAPASVTL